MTAIGTCEGVSEMNATKHSTACHYVIISMVQMMEKMIYSEVLLCIYSSNGCTARGPAGFFRLALTRRIVLLDGNVNATSSKREKSRKPL